MAGPRQPRTKKAAPRAADDLRRADREQAEDALRESEEMQRILLEGSPDPIFSFTPEGRYRYVNQAFAEGVGKTVEGIIGKTIWDILSQEEADKRFAALSQVLRTGEEVVIEGRVPRADGDRYFVTTISPLKDPEGRVTSAICSAKDITAREHAEEALRQSEERHREMIAGISDVIAIMAVDGTLRYKSPNIERHFGWLPEDLVGTNGWETVHPDDLERIQREFLALLDEHDSVVTVEYRYKCKDGGYKMIELTATNLTNSPLIDGVLMNYHDITARRQAEQSVRESEQRLLRAQGMAHVGNWELDLRTRTMWASEEAFRVYGIEHTAPTLPLDLVKAGALPEYRPGLDEALERLIAGQAEYDEEFELRRANDGRVRVVHSIAELVRADDGAPTSVVGAVQDVTELKAAEREALDAAAQLRRTVEGAVLA
ncbi:MAG: PAS domain S-box protein, partial [Actinomycetes bacterium]